MGRSVVGRFKSEVKERIVRLEKEMSKGFGSTELPKYRAFSPTYTELEIATELYRNERLGQLTRSLTQYVVKQLQPVRSLHGTRTGRLDVNFKTPLPLTTDAQLVHYRDHLSILSL